MKGSIRRARRLGIAVLTLALALSVAAVSQAQERDDLSRLVYANRVAQQLVDLNLTQGQLVELRAAVVAVKEAKEQRVDRLVSLLQERKAAILAGDADRVSEIDKELREASSGRLADIPEVKSFLEGLTERQKLVLSTLLGEEFVRVRDAAPQRTRITVHFMGGRVVVPHGPQATPFAGGSGVDLDVLLGLIDEMLR